jgi:hypothetical protein
MYLQNFEAIFLVLSSLRFCLICSPSKILSCPHNRILHRIALRHASGHLLRHLLPIKTKGKRTGVALLSTLVDDPVYRTHEEIIRLQHKAIRNIPYKGSRNGLRLDPFASFTQDLRAATVILCAGREALKICMHTISIWSSSAASC